MRGLVFSLLFLTASPGCFLFSKEPMVVAKELVAQERKQEAVKYLIGKIDQGTEEKASLVMADYGSQLAHLDLRDYQAATFFYRYIANFSKNQEEQLSALRYLGIIYFDHLRDFELAISVFESILRYPLGAEEKAKYRLLLGKSHYNLAQLEQAEAELKAFRELSLPKPLVYEGDVFESNILVSKKEHEEAANILKRLLREHPERAKSDGLELNLVACYEDMKDFDAAIEAMEEMKINYPDPEFLEMRIARLKERKNNMPGAKGLRK